MIKTTQRVPGVAAIARRLSAHRTLVAAGLSLLAFVAGVISASLGHDRVALVCVLVLQAGIVFLLLLLLRRPSSPAPASTTVQRSIDEASTRVLADLARARQAILAAVDELSERP